MYPRMLWSFHLLCHYCDKPHFPPRNAPYSYTIIVHQISRMSPRGRWQLFPDPPQLLCSRYLTKEWHQHTWDLFVLHYSFVLLIFDIQDIAFFLLFHIFLQERSHDTIIAFLHEILRISPRGRPVAPSLFLLELTKRWDKYLRVMFLWFGAIWCL